MAKDSSETPKAPQVPVTPPPTIKKNAKAKLVLADELLFATKPRDVHIAEKAHEQLAIDALNAQNQADYEKAVEHAKSLGRAPGSVKKPHVYSVADIFWSGYKKNKTVDDRGEVGEEVLIGIVTNDAKKFYARPE